MFLEKLFANSLRGFFKKFKALIPNANLYYANDILSKILRWRLWQEAAFKPDKEI